MRVMGVVVMVAFLFACGRSREEQEALNKQYEIKRAAETKHEAEELVRLEGIVEFTRSHCAAEFQRATAESLGPATEGKGCTLPSNADLKFTYRSPQPTLARVSSQMAGACDDYVKDLDLKVKQTLFKKSAGDVGYMLSQIDATWLVAVVYDAYKQPTIHPELAGGPKTFQPGSIAGVAYLYSVRSGTLECAGAVSAVSSTEVEAFKRDTKLEAEIEGDDDVVGDLFTKTGKALQAGKTFPLVANGYKAPPPPPPASSPAPTKRRHH